ncbi:MAG: DUF3842 family protein [Clostridiaceae bacterium]|jgi:hypothetical protein|nr:DUF3842 family protein [Clostridiaceae bacterium]
MKTIVVIDGKGGGVGSALIARLKGLSEIRLLALGANALATSAMLRAGAQDGATGENAVIQCCRQADVVAGPIGILIAGAMLGEITAPMAAAVGQSPARLVLIPNAKSGAHICGLQQMPLSQYIEEAAKKIEEILGE